MSKEDKLTKKDIAAKLGISRPTLDKYLENGLPGKFQDNVDNKRSLDFKKILLENDIRVLEFQIADKKRKLADLQKAIDEFNDLGESFMVNFTDIKEEDGRKMTALINLIWFVVLLCKMPDYSPDTNAILFSLWALSNVIMLKPIGIAKNDKKEDEQNG